MQPFKINQSLLELVEIYPRAQDILDVARAGGEQARVALARLWLSEGIPFAFKDCPGIYEVMRTWLSACLSVEAKSINLSGSARLGSSLSPHKLNKSFDQNSDLDIFIVSEVLFNKLSDDFRKWSYEFEMGITPAGNKKIQELWVDNHNRGFKLIQRGFFDSKLVPNYEQFQTTRNVHQTMWLLVEKLRVTRDAPKVKKASVRCYQGWEAFIRQTILNLSK